MKAINLSDGAVVGENIQPAFSFWPRFKGLLGRRFLAEGEGLLLHPCDSIHCLGMRFTIDAVFLDRDFRVLAIRESMRPGAVASCKKACYVLELAAGNIARCRINIGDWISFEEIQTGFNQSINGNRGDTNR